MPRMRWTAFFTCALLLLAGAAALAADDPPGRRHLIYFEGTDYELHVFKITGEKPGNTLMIIGGIQGNEPGSYLSADLYADLSLIQGNLIVVPRANFLSILKGLRGINHDMNRRFAGPRQRLYEDEVVSVLKRLMAESTLLLNLHDGSGFYHPTYVDDRRNPMRYGQSIIADTDRFFSPKLNRDIHMREICERVLARVNPHVKDPDHRFRFNNHRTASPDTIHAEQRKSATYYAITKLGIPAFGVETSKDIERDDAKVRYQTMIINEFMREFGIIPQYPGIRLDPPKLKYLIIEVNHDLPLVLENGRTLAVNPGDVVKVTHVEANYDRGIAVDVTGVGGYNDFRKPFQVTRPAEININKDGRSCGQVFLALKTDAPAASVVAEAPAAAPHGQVVSSGAAAAPSVSDAGTSPYLTFTLIAGGRRHEVEAEEALEVVRGDVLELESVSTNMADHASLNVNFKGFVGDKLGNSGEDRGYRIDTATALMPKYSLEGKGDRYRIVAQDGDRTLGEMEVRLVDPKVAALVLSVNRENPVEVPMGERLRLHRGATLQILSARDRDGRDLGSLVKVNFVGFQGGPNGEDRDYLISLDHTLLASYSLERKGQVYPIKVTHGAKELGRVLVELQ